MGILLDKCVFNFQRRNPSAGMRDYNDMALNKTEYYKYQNDIRKLVPPHLLFEFDHTKHGWKELAQFIDRPVPANGPLPKANARGPGKVVTALLTSPAKHVVVLLLLLGSIVANGI